MESRWFFYYNEVVGNHFQFRDSVDAHNAKRHDCGTKQGLGIEQTWATTRWPCRAFSFILGVAEVNAYLLMKYFGGFSGTQWDFRKKLAFELVHNPWDTDKVQEDGDGRRVLRSNTTHELISAPRKSKWTDKGWEEVYRVEYQQHFCSTPGCQKRIKTVLVLKGDFCD